MNNTVYNVLTQNNKVKYLQDNILSVNNGINYFNGLWKPVITLSYSSKISTGMISGEPVLIRSTSQNIKCNDTVLTRFYGTITRDNTADNTAFYILDNAGPQNDNGAIIPVNPYTNVTTFDFVTICHRSDETWYYIYLWFNTLDKFYNNISTPCYLDLKIDYFAL